MPTKSTWMLAYLRSEQSLKVRLWKSFEWLWKSLEWKDELSRTSLSSWIFLNEIKDRNVDLHWLMKFQKNIDINWIYDYVLLFYIYVKVWIFRNAQMKLWEAWIANKDRQLSWWCELVEQQNQAVWCWLVSKRINWCELEEQENQLLWARIARESVVVSLSSKRNNCCELEEQENQVLSEACRLW